MLLSAVQPFTQIDYPDHTAAIAFLPGCNFRCGYCHNPEFVSPELIEKIRDSFVPQEAFFSFLDSRRGLLDGVVISGGEPTLMPDLPEFIAEIRARGFKVKLDTNGYMPERIQKLIERGLVDYIAMDLKADATTYNEITGVKVDMNRIIASLGLIRTSGIEYEFRTTLVREIHTTAVITEMERMVHGVKRWYWQEFRPHHVLNRALMGYHSYTREELMDLARQFTKTSITIRYS